MMRLGHVYVSPAFECVLDTPYGPLQLMAALTAKLTTRRYGVRIAIVRPGWGHELLTLEESVDRACGIERGTD